ncbi:MAG: ABC transporter ATP-binding protein, partial [Hyphomicrobium sp.]|nr:ABC transporter ATP-binding protein [Hyphomicrobium sp.]
VYVMYAGRIVEEGDVYGIFANPRHPYTRALLSSTLSPDRRIEKLAPIDGQPPNLITPPPGCRFHPRCRERMARCSEEAPPNFDIAPGASARCWLYEEAARVGAP